MEDVKNIVRQQAEDALNKLGVQGMVPPEYVADCVVRQMAYWEKALPDDQKLLFVRLSSPVVQREEVFLGSILLNAFLSKSFARAVCQNDLGKAELIANDLENYYFLLRTTSDVAQIVGRLRVEIQRGVPDLFFGEQDEARGIYGSLETMLAFEKTNVEPFPVFVMPASYEARLEERVRKSLLLKVANTPLDQNPTSIMANLAFFYSHDGNEMQSPANFLGNLAFRYDVISTTELEDALNIPKSDKKRLNDLIKKDKELLKSQKKGLAELISDIAQHTPPRSLGWLEVFLSRGDKGTWRLDAGKPANQKSVARLVSKRLGSESAEDLFQEVVKVVVAHRLSAKGTCSSERLRGVLKHALIKLGEKAEADGAGWRLPFIRNKFFPRDEEALAGALLDGLSLGHTVPSSFRVRSDAGCRLCGMKPMVAPDKSILMGQGTHRFHNQSAKQKSGNDPKTCLRCAVCTYLMVKLIGSEAVGQPQVPKTYNLIFHYGKHGDPEVDAIARGIDRIWGLVQQHRDARQIRNGFASQLRELKAKHEQEQDLVKKQTVAEDEIRKEMELQRAEASLKKIEDDIFVACPWLRNSDGSPEPAENVSLDVLGNIQLSETKVERHVLGLGMGGYRMILFVLPQIRAPGDKQHDFAQRRFSDSRVTVAAVLSFLRELCGCDGPFYYQSLPTLTPEAFRRDTFYIRNEPVSIKQAQTEYEAVTQLAWRLVRRQRQTESGSELFVRKVLLAEELLLDPLARFSAVMRDSPILGVKLEPKKQRFKALPGGYRPDWKAQDLTEYGKFIQRLSRVQEEKSHGTAGRP